MSGKVTGSEGKGFSAEIRIEGLDATLAALRALEPDVLKRLQTELRGIAGKISAQASAAAPPGHSLSYRIQARGRGKKAGMSIRAKDRDSAIFEFAGTKMSNKAQSGPPSPQGAAMISWLNTFGSPGRFLWGAWDANAASTDASIRLAVRKAEAELQANLNAAGEVF